MMRIFDLLLIDKPRSCGELMELTGMSGNAVYSALRGLRGLRCAAVTGDAVAAQWFRVPGAKRPIDRRGALPTSRANLKLGPAAAANKPRLNSEPNPATELERCMGFMR